MSNSNVIGGILELQINNLLIMLVLSPTVIRLNMLIECLGMAILFVEQIK